MAERILRPDEIPETLWNSKHEALLIPSKLAKIYCDRVDYFSLRELGTARPNGDGPVGGITQAQTDQHFAQSFDGSVARAQLAILDPKWQLGNVSNAFIFQLAGGNTCLTDAPCGCGAATYAILATIAELRELEILPRIPLTVTMIGAEISEPARAHAQGILNELKPWLLEQAITVNEEFYSWDATNQVSTTSLIKTMTIKASDKDKRLILIANFSGFLSSNERRKKAQNQLTELLRYASGENSLGIWIEPQMPAAISNNGVFFWFNKQINGLLKLFVTNSSSENLEKTHLTTACKFVLPLQPRETTNVRLAVMSMILNSEKND